MQIDYIYIKEILTAIRDGETFFINREGLKDALNIDAPAKLDKFLGHLSLLEDFGVIEELSSDIFRMTAKGYDFLDMLNNDSACSLINGYGKGLTVSVEIGKRALCY